MSKEKANDLSTVAWLNLILGIYNIYLFTMGNLLFNLIIGSLNIGVWVFFRNPKTVLSLSNNKSRNQKED